jgi:hypothetical protein
MAEMRRTTPLPRGAQGIPGKINPGKINPGKINPGKINKDKEKIQRGVPTVVRTDG